MTPLLRTKTPSAPVGDKSAGDGRAARSLLSCALWRGMGRLWRGMGGMGRPEPLFAHHPHRQQDLSGFHETRDTRHESRLFFESQLPCPRFPTISHDFPAFPGISRHFPAPPTPPPPIKCPRAVRLSWSAARDCRPRPVAAFLRVVARHGRLWRGMGGRRPPRRQHGLSVFSSNETRNMLFPSPSGDSKESNPKPGQQVFTNHETRDTKHGFYSSLPTISHDFPAFPAISRGVGGAPEQVFKRR